MAIEEGKPAPDFTLTDQHGQSRSLADYRGRDVVVYFYPKDDTPGCTKEACGFRDLWHEISATGVVVLGVSPDNADSHLRFIDKYGLPLDLLSDPDKAMMTEYGAFGEKVLYGRKTTGVIRSTVWIGPDGNVVKHWKKVPKAADHPERVLKSLTGDK